MKNIIITGGPTNEFIDEVMKITNMSTGSLSISLTELFLKKGYRVTLIINRSVSIKDLRSYEELGQLIVHPVETTEEMLNSLKGLSGKDICYDMILHAAAVGDYKADFSFLMDTLAHELFEGFKKDMFKDEDQLLKYLEAGSYRIDNQSKISSYQDSLAVKLGLTPKIIGNLKDWYPESLLVGCKLLEKVTKEELYQVAQKLATKNKMDYILANDLNDLRMGKASRYLVNSEGYTGVELKTSEDICNYFHEIIQ